MTPLPKRRLSRARAGRRQMGQRRQATGGIKLVKCPNCQALKKPHQVCPNCGQYNNRVVVIKKTKKKSEKSA